MPGAELKHTILVIEDELQIRRFLRATLLAHGYRCLEATTGEDGLRLASSQQPDVVILDLGLPDIDGLEVARRLREWASTPIIILSARGQETDRIAALDTGADDYLTKPAGAGELRPEPADRRRKDRPRHGVHRHVADGLQVVDLKIDAGQHHPPRELTCA